MSSACRRTSKEIFYLTGESPRTVENSPHLEAFKDQGYKVLYLVEPVDELMVQSLIGFKGKRLKSVGKGTVQLGSEVEQKQAEKKLKEQTESYAGLLELLQQKKAPGRIGLCGSNDGVDTGWIWWCPMPVEA